MAEKWNAWVLNQVNVVHEVLAHPCADIISFLANCTNEEWDNSKSFLAGLEEEEENQIAEDLEEVLWAGHVLEEKLKESLVSMGWILLAGAADHPIADNKEDEGE